MIRKMAILAILLAILGLPLSSVSAGVQRPPERVSLTPGVVETGSAVTVAFWGAEPGSTVTVKVQDADTWSCHGDTCGPERFSMPTLLVQADEGGHGYFAVGVPCGYPPGLLRLDVGGMEVSVAVRESEACREYSGWVR